MSGFIYLIKAAGSGRVKIGFSVKPKQRLIELQTGSPLLLDLIDTWQASETDEPELHRMFQSFWAHHEWFEVDAEDAKRWITAYFNNPTSRRLVETALVYARKIGSAETLEQAREYARVVVDQLEEVSAKIKRQKGR